MSDLEAHLNQGQIHVKLSPLLNHEFMMGIGISKVQNYIPINFYLSSDQFRQTSVSFKLNRIDPIHHICEIQLNHVRDVWMGTPYKTDIFIRDKEEYIDLSGWLNQFAMTMLIEAYYFVDENFDAKVIENEPVSTSIDLVKIIPERNTLHFCGQISLHSSYSKLSTYSAEFHFNLCQLASIPMVGRVGDPQIGYFYDDMYIDAKNNKGIAGEVITIINRLNLDKAPWLFIVDRSITRKFQPAIKTGVLSWNFYFEKLGLGSPFRVLIEGDQGYPEGEIDVFDTRAWYIIGTEINQFNGPYSGYSIHIDDYRSGENLFGLISLNLIKIAAVPTRIYYMKGLSQGHPQNSQQLNQFIRLHNAWVTAHETGHQLGFRHNFLGNLKANSYDNTNGSVMDYIDLFSNFKDIGDLQINEVNRKYDLKAVEYGYCLIPDEVTGRKHPMLTALVEQTTTQFGTDENYSEGVNPDVGIFENTPETLEYIKNNLKLYKDYRNNLIKSVANQTLTPFEYNNMFIYLYLAKFTEMINTCVKFIGGRSYSRDRTYYINADHQSVVDAVELLLQFTTAIEYTDQEYSYFIYDYAINQTSRQGFNPVKLLSLYSMNTTDLFGIYQHLINQIYAGVTSVPNLIRLFQNHLNDFTVTDLLFNFTFACSKSTSQLQSKNNISYEIINTPGIFSEIGLILTQQSNWQIQILKSSKLKRYCQTSWIAHLSQCYTNPDLLIIRSDLHLLLTQLQSVIIRKIIPYIETIQVPVTTINWKSTETQSYNHWKLIEETIDDILTNPISHSVVKSKDEN